MRQAFAREGIEYLEAKEKSQAYLELEVLFAQGRIELLDHPQLIRELKLLECRVKPGGRKVVDRPRGGHDDYANSNGFGLDGSPDGIRKHASHNRVFNIDGNSGAHPYQPRVSWPSLPAGAQSGPRQQAIASTVWRAYISDFSNKVAIRMAVAQIRGKQLSTTVLTAVVAVAVGIQNSGRHVRGQGIPDSASSSKVDFAREILPIFEKSCYSCHGPKQQMRGLRLDSKKLALAGGQFGKVIYPYKASESPLYRRVAGIGNQVRMPMGGEPLDREQIARIRAWINQGAKWPEGVGAEVAEIEKHWAYVPPKRPYLPKISRRDWAANPIDSFVLARLEKEGLSPSPEADRVTLLRRLSLDLIGLPPTIQEVNAFLSDSRENAYQIQVERLLSSPHYGERWGQHWLDAARYADSNGYEKDLQREVWFYRDWVIEAFNRDLPYNQFIIEQLAGDLLPNATQDQIVATGLLRNSMINEEGGVDPEQFRMEAMFDRMDAIGKSILGITIQCAQCHDHKYDPLTQEEYYRMFAFLNNSHEAKIRVYTRKSK